MSKLRLRNALATPLLLLALVGQAQAGYVDSINPNATPEDFVTLGFNSIGWYYTPSQNYSLTGISSFFAFTEFGSGPRTVTAQIQSATPASGGVVLDQGTFTASGTDDVVDGASFATPSS